MVLQIVIFGAGARVGFFQGDIKLLPDDMKTLQPTIFPVVPRLLNRVYDKVSSASCLTHLLRLNIIIFFFWCSNRKIHSCPGAERCCDAIQKMAAQLCGAEEIGRGAGGHSPEKQPMGQAHLPQSAGPTTTRRDETKTVPMK